MILMNGDELASNAPDSAGSQDDLPAWKEGLSLAQRGALPVVGALLERYRPYLLSIASQELPPVLVGKVGASDLVQDTFVKGYQCIGQFEGGSPEQLAAWLRQILLNQICNVIKSYEAQKRDVAREHPADGTMESAGGRSPLQAALSRERQELLETALAQLPQPMQQVILLRHRENLSYAQIAVRMQRSDEYARRLWGLAVLQLHKMLSP